MADQTKAIEVLDIPIVEPVASVPRETTPSIPANPASADYDDGLDGPIISFAGKDAIKDAWEKAMEADPSEKNAVKFVHRFRARHRLHHSHIDEVVNFLEAAGIGRNQLSKEIMSNMVNIIKQKIPALTQPQLATLLDSSYTYLTVPELAPIAITALEHLKVVKPTVWAQIVANGLEESPYTDLPLAIKHRIWVQESEAFDHEIDVILSSVGDSIPPTIAELEKNVTIEARKAKGGVLANLLRLVQGLSDDLIGQTAEKLYNKTCSEQSPSRRTALANLFHDFAIHAPSRSHSSILFEVKKCARFLSIASSSILSPEDVRMIYNAVLNSPVRPYVALLLCSSISRDVLADQLVGRLSSLRSPSVVNQLGESTPEATQQLKSDTRLGHLTCLMLYNIKAANVLTSGEIILPEDVEGPFEEFFPTMLAEMERDAAWKKDDYFLFNCKMPTPKLLQMATQGKFERRVIATYCLSLLAHGDFINLSRFRLVIDSIIATCDPKEESREFILAQALTRKASDFEQ